MSVIYEGYEVTGCGGRSSKALTSMNAPLFWVSDAVLRIVMYDGCTTLYRPSLYSFSCIVRFFIGMIIGHVSSCLGVFI